jgi:hypothetical protein
VAGLPWGDCRELRQACLRKEELREECLGKKVPSAALEFIASPPPVIEREQRYNFTRQFRERLCGPDLLLEPSFSRGVHFIQYHSLVEVLNGYAT